MSATNGRADGFIYDDDALVQLSTPSVTQTEGDGVWTPYTYTLTRTGYLNQNSIVYWSVENTLPTGFSSTQYDATNGFDFIGNVTPSGAVTFLPGETSKTFTFNVWGDSGSPGNYPTGSYWPYYVYGGYPNSSLERDEAFKVNISAGSIGTETPANTVAGDYYDILPMQSAGARGGRVAPTHRGKSGLALLCT